MTSSKIGAGDAFPAISVQALDNTFAELGTPETGADWKMVVVYRGRHCPLCTKYLNQLESYRQRLLGMGVDLAAVSADSRSQLEGHREKLTVGFPLYFGLTIEQMKTLGVYISMPRSEKETDHLFPEPGLFVINAERRVQVVDVSNNPFVRPDLASLISGLEWIRNPENDYPIRGTYR